MKTNSENLEKGAVIDPNSEPQGVPRLPENPDDAEGVVIDSNNVPDFEGELPASPNVDVNSEGIDHADISGKHVDDYEGVEKNTDTKGNEVWEVKNN